MKAIYLTYPACLLAFLSHPLIITAGAAEPYANFDSSFSAPSTVQGKTMLIPAGTTFEGRLDSKIGSSSSRPGQRFTLTMSSPVLGNGVDVLIPAGTQIIGEVVEAIASSRLPHHKGEIKPTGKLRVQINGLRFPDGLTYPLVASLVGESSAQKGGYGNNPSLGGIGYVGSAASFETVAPGSQDKYGRRRGAGRVMTKEELQRDPMYGRDSSQDGYRQQQNTIRSLVRRGYDLYIDQGSPLSVRLDAPLKVVINPGSAAAFTAAPPVNEGSKRFKRGERSNSTKVEPESPRLPVPPARTAPAATPADNSF